MDPHRDRHTLTSAPHACGHTDRHRDRKETTVSLIIFLRPILERSHGLNKTRNKLSLPRTVTVQRNQGLKRTKYPQ